MLYAMLRNPSFTSALLIPMDLRMRFPARCVMAPNIEMFYLLWNALNSLPEVQGRRVDAYLILGKTYRQIAREEGVDKCAVRRSVKSGITHMKKYLRKNF